MALYGPVTPALTNVPKIATTATFAVDSGYTKSIAITSTNVTKGVYLYALTTNTTGLSVRTFASQAAQINHIVGVSSAGFLGGCYYSHGAQDTVATYPYVFPSTINVNQANHTTTCWQFQYGVQ